MADQFTFTIQPDAESSYYNLGSIEGTLEAINLDGAAAFTIWDRVSRAPVRCYFPKNPIWIDRVSKLLDTRVLVRGKVYYFSNGVPRSIVEVTDISDTTPDPNLPKGDFGSIPDIIAGEDSVEFLRAIRE